MADILVWYVFSSSLSFHFQDEIRPKPVGWLNHDHVVTFDLINGSEPNSFWSALSMDVDHHRIVCSLSVQDEAVSSCWSPLEPQHCMSSISISGVICCP